MSTAPTPQRGRNRKSSGAVFPPFSHSITKRHLTSFVSDDVSNQIVLLKMNGRWPVTVARATSRVDASVISKMRAWINAIPASAKVDIARKTVALAKTVSGFPLQNCHHDVNGGVGAEIGCGADSGTL